jgi:hypothetical protein
VSFDLCTPDRAILSFSIKGTLVRLAFSYEQTGILRTDASRVHHAMTAARQARVVEETKTDPLPSD